MPIYEFQCRSCGHQFERVTQSYRDKPSDVDCPKCEKLVREALISAPSVSGWKHSLFRETPEHMVGKLGFNGE